MVLDLGSQSALDLNPSCYLWRCNHWVGKMSTKPKRKREPTKASKPKEGRAKILSDFKSFKKRLHRMIDQSEVKWIGEPWEEGSKYSFGVMQGLFEMVSNLHRQNLEFEALRTSTRLHKAAKGKP